MCIPAPGKVAAKGEALPCPALLCPALLCSALLCLASHCFVLPIKHCFVQLQLDTLVVTQPCGCRHGLQEVVKNVYQVASALQHMHSQQLIHQDLHAGNVLTTLDGRAWQVADFGAASWTHHQGTPVLVTHFM